MDRSEYRSDTGIAAWWQKDGAWHIAIPEPGRDGFYWTPQQFGTREQAIEALNKLAQV